MNKKISISKRYFYELLRVQRKYRLTGDTDILSYRNELCRDLERSTKLNWFNFEEITSVFARLKTTDKKVEEVMNILGFELLESE